MLRFGCVCDAGMLPGKRKGEVGGQCWAAPARLTALQCDPLEARGGEQGDIPTVSSRKQSGDIPTVISVCFIS